MSQCIWRLSFPLTAAGQPGILTRFPIAALLRALTESDSQYIGPQEPCQHNILGVEEGYGFGKRS